MAILKVARLGHPVLRHKASDVEIKDIKAGKLRALIDDMIETMHEYEGVGLAGPQVHMPPGRTPHSSSPGLTRCP